ncbi:hypothetical protein Ddc_01499 [Ditylenchus destructor]|nr:hypothetical protein Ddc_01499 [Ditylenchus destructor]
MFRSIWLFILIALCSGVIGLEINAPVRRSIATYNTQKVPQYLTLNPVNVPAPAYQPQQQNIQTQWPAPPPVPSAPIAAPAPPPPAAFSAPQPAPTYQSEQQNVQPQWSAQAPATSFVAPVATYGTNAPAGASLASQGAPVNIGPSPTSQFPSQTPTAQNGAASGVSESATAGVQGNSAAVQSSSTGDFNPELVGGIPGNPGIIARINRKAFDFAGKLIGPVLNKQVRGAQIPNIQQCLPQVGGCIHVSNVQITNYRCPRRITARPAPPNQIVLVVQDLDVSASANLNGRVDIMVPVALFGTVRLQLQRVSIRVNLAIENQASGGANVRVVGCRASIGQATVFIDNGGLLGDIANGQLQRKFNSVVKKMLPSQLCSRLPGIINEQVNSQLGGAPQRMSLMQLLGAILSSSGGIETLLGGGDEESTGACNAESTTAAPVQRRKAVALAGVALVSQKAVKRNNTLRAMPTIKRTKKTAPQTTAPLRRTARQDVPTGTADTGAGNSVATSTDAATNSSNPCEGCPGVSSCNDNSALLTIAQQLDISKLSEVFLNVRMLRTQATSNDFTLEATGEFTSDANPTNPFYPFPMQFPPASGNKMIEAVINTPKIGALLKTTCGAEEEDGLEDHGVETEDLAVATTAAPADITTEAVGRKIRKIRKTESAIQSARPRRQDESGGGLADLGICLGDILPAIREKYPNKNLNVQVTPTRAPSVIFKDGGIATLDAVANADFMLESGEKVGTIQVIATIDMTITYNGKFEAEVAISKLELHEVGNSLGLPQDALDNLASLGKDMFSKQSPDNPLFSLKNTLLNLLNKSVGNGKKLEIPAGIVPVSLPPVTLVDPDVRVINHALYLGTDISISNEDLAAAGLTDDSCPNLRRKV